MAEQEREEKILRRKEALGLTVQKITMDMMDKLMDFLWEHFFQQEPVTASMNLQRSWFIDKFWFPPFIKLGDSYAAINSGGEIVGVRLGRQMNVNDKLSKYMDIIAEYITVYGCKLTRSRTDYTKMFVVSKLLNYDPWKFMQEKNHQKIYEALIMSVDNSCRGKGIGEILMHDVNKIMKSSGCECTYALYTSKYSTAISQNLGNVEVLSSAKYEELVDKDGNLILPKHEEHTVLADYTKMTEQEQDEKILQKKETLGLTVQKITMDMMDKLMDFLWEHFMNQEPVTASMNMQRSWFIDKLWFPSLIKLGDSYATMNSNGEIVGVRLGRQMNVNDKFSKYMDIIGNNVVIYGSKLTRSTTDFSKYDLVNKIMNYDAWNFMEEKNNQKICEIMILCVDKSYRGKGIGEILMHDVNKIMKSSGCECTYALYTSKYSAAISQNLGNVEVLKSMKYEELVDKDGNLILPKHGEHTAIEVRTTKL